MGKKDARIIYGGNEIARLEKSLPDPETGEVYTKLRTKLNGHFTQKKNKHLARYLFLKMRLQVGETISAYAARLREKAKECEFDERIVEHIIETTDNKKLIERATSKTLDLTRFLTEASQTEDIVRQIQDMGTEQVDHAGRVQSVPAISGSQHQMKPWKCGFCGLIGAHVKGKDCPAFGKKCNKCHKWNHFVVCKFQSNRFRKQKPGKGKVKRRIKKTTEAGESTSSDDEFFGQAAEHLSQAKKVKQIGGVGTTSRCVKVKLNDVDVQMEADSGADVNIMDEHQFKAFVHRSSDKPVLQPSNVKLYTLQHKLDVKGEFRATIRNDTCGRRVTFVVVFGRIKSPPLIGKETLIGLGMLKIQPNGSLAEPNSLGISSDGCAANTVKDTGMQEMEDLVAKYSHLFEGIGKMEDKKRGKEILGRFHMKASAIPVAQKPRSVPYYLQEPLKKWLDQGLTGDIFEKVPDDEPITWCSPVVVQLKPKFAEVPPEKLEPNMIRASVDLRVPNQYMERSRTAQAPVLEDFTHKFHDCSIWTKLDLRQGYHQLMLHPESRSVATSVLLLGATSGLKDWSSAQRPLKTCLMMRCHGSLETFLRASTRGMTS